MIDSLFGSRTRVKLLHLFLSNPTKSFYVREITRLIDEQINSVRRELANMLEVGIITSDSSDNKLYYSANQKYEHFLPLREIFVGQRDSGVAKVPKTPNQVSAHKWSDGIVKLPGLRLAVLAGSLVRGSASPVDILLVGSISQSKVEQAVKSIESQNGKEIQYSVMSYDDFYYRLSVRDRFVSEVLTGKYVILLDTEKVLG